MLPFTVVFLLYLSLCRAGDPCPPKDQLRFCTCSRKELSLTDSPTSAENSTEVPQGNTSASDLGGTFLYTVVECNVSRSIILLKDTIISGLHRKLVDKLTVYNVPPAQEHFLARLPSRWLRNTRVKQLEIKDSFLSEDFLWYGDPFDGQEQSLILLRVNNCFLYGSLTAEVPGTVNTKNLHHFPYVEVVDFSDNRLTVITTSAFENPPANLSTINLSRNSIHTILVGAFEKVQNLKSVDLSYNLLKSLESWNSLKSLSPEFFSNMPALKTVHLANNYLYSLPDKPWSLIWNQLVFMDVEGNFINCDCSLLWMLSSKSSVNGTTEAPPPADVSRPVKTLKGKCIYHKLPMYVGIEYKLATLVRNQLMCSQEWSRQGTAAPYELLTSHEVSRNVTSTHASTIIDQLQTDYLHEADGEYISEPKDLDGEVGFYSDSS